MSKTKRKSIKKVTPSRKGAKKTTSGRVRYTYDTEVRVVAEKYGIELDVPPETKMGDFFKMKGFDSLARIMKMMN